MAVTKKHVDKIWKFCDSNGDGRITQEELYNGFNSYLESKGRARETRAMCERMFSGIDSSTDGKITKRELEKELLERDKRRESLLRDFRNCERKRDGTISIGEIRNIIGESSCIKPYQVDSIMEAICEKADKDESGFLGDDELQEIMDQI